MANTASAEKRNRQRITRRTRNVQQMSKLRTFVKRARTTADEATTAAAAGTVEAVKSAIVALDKAAQKGLIKKRTASRTISRLTKMVQRKPAAASK